MINKLITAVCAAVFAFASNAATVTGDGFEIEYSTNLDYVSSYSAGPIGGVNFATDTHHMGAFTIESNYFQSADPTDKRYTLLIETGLSVVEPKDIQLRFSYWSVDYQLDIFDVTSGTFLQKINYKLSGAGAVGWDDGRQINLSTESSHEIRITGSYTFSPGHVLTPSPDSNCQAFTCMTAESDKLVGAHVRFAVSSPVPELQTWPMLAMGLGVIGIVGQRRRRA
ncbi:hypothetical protein [Roseateles sp. P5_E4]